jgi:hypothetical protein
MPISLAMLGTSKQAEIMVYKSSVSAARKLSSLRFAGFFVLSLGMSSLAGEAHAQSFQFGSVNIEGNQRVEDGTIL